MVRDLLNIELSPEQIELCQNYHGGIGCKMCATASTGALRPGTECPFTTWTDEEDKQIKWHYVLWRDLACDVYFTHTQMSKGDRWDVMNPDIEKLQEFEKFCDGVLTEFDERYPHLQAWIDEQDDEDWS